LGGCLIRQGKVALTVGDSDHLPFPDRHFDKALSVHTFYFWINPEAHLREMPRVLACGGRLVLGFRSKGEMAEDFRASVYTFYTAEEVRGLLEASGFERVDLARAPGGLLTATAWRPSAA
jgi:ubiquinone/menaquinone biosynthesis C-methylase UbiE